MPTIRIEYDDQQVPDEEILALSKATQKILQEITGIDDTFVYGNSARIKVGIAPIEVYVQLSAHHIKDIDAFLEEIKNRLTAWKKEVNYQYPINLTLMPMQWKFEVGI